jgi:hypothetical protein
MNAPTAAMPLRWDDATELLGVHVRAHFFDPAEVDLRETLVERRLPVFERARPRLLGDEERVYAVGDLWAQPHAVYEHGFGLLCLTHRHTLRLLVDPDRWKTQLRVDTVLQSVAVAMAVAGVRQLPTAPLLRLGNALLLVAPGPPVLECLASSVSAARRHWKASRGVSAAQLASFCEPLLRELPGVRAPASSAG